MVLQDEVHGDMNSEVHSLDGPIFEILFHMPSTPIIESSRQPFERFVQAKTERVCKT